MTSELTKFSPESDMALYDEQIFGRMINLAEMISQGKHAVPDAFKGNVPDCMAIVTQSKLWGINPFAVIQKAHVIHGKIGYESQLIVSAVNKLAPTQDRLHIEWFGPWERIVGQIRMTGTGQKQYPTQGWNPADEEGLGVKVYATLNGESKPRELELLLKQCFPRNSTLWATDPKQQIAYLAQRRWARLFCPDVILGVYTPDELHEYKNPEVKEIPKENVIIIDDEPARDAEATPAAIEKIKELLKMVSPEDCKKMKKAAEDREWKYTQDEAEKIIAPLTAKARKYQESLKQVKQNAETAPKAEPVTEPAPEQSQSVQDEAKRMQDEAKRMRQVMKIGSNLYGDKWAKFRRGMVQQINPEYTSSKELSSDELGRMLETLLAEEQKANAANNQP